MYIYLLSLVTSDLLFQMNMHYSYARQYTLVPRMYFCHSSLRKEVRRSATGRTFGSTGTRAHRTLSGEFVIEPEVVIPNPFVGMEILFLMPAFSRSNSYK